jgi:hypothetical protein
MTAITRIKMQITGKELGVAQFRVFRIGAVIANLRVGQGQRSALHLPAQELPASQLRRVHFIDFYHLFSRKIR